MPLHDFKFAVSSLSCAPADIFRPQDVLIPSLATIKTIKRIVQLRRALAHIIPENKFSTSFHVGYMIDTVLAIEEMKKHTISISSLDTPDIRPITDFLADLGHNIVRADIKDISEHIGWQLASVTKYQNYKRKVRKGLDALPASGGPHFIRTSGGSWYKSDIGEQLIAHIKEKRIVNPSLALAIEIDAQNQTPDDYFSLISRLAEAHPDLPVYFDLDIGHLAQSLDYHHTFVHETLLDLISTILNDPQKSSRIGLISLNQYDHKEKDIHIALMDGSIDYLAIMRLCGQASRNGSFTVVPTILAEFSPLEYNRMISPEGIQYFESMQKAFYEK